MKDWKIAFIPIARKTFDIPLARKVTDAARENLIDAGFSLYGPEDLIMDLSAAEMEAKKYSEVKPDLLVIFQATFADTTMVKMLTETTHTPILLWAVPEVAVGGRLRLNSLCGINLAGHALRKRGRQYLYIYTEPNDKAAVKKIEIAARAGHVHNLLLHSRVGVVGQHPLGLDTCDYDTSLLKLKLGVEIVPISLERVFDYSGAIQETKIDQVRSDLGNKLDNLQELEQKPLNCSLRVYAALKKIADEEKLDGLAVRCWPEFFTQLGCAACGALSMLTDEGIPSSCEADVNGAITQLILQWLSGGAAFGSDFVSVNIEEDSGVLWHCGKAPLSMADPNVQPKGGVHSNRKLPLVMEFPLKPGVVTVARISQATGDLRLVVGKAEMLSAPISFSGTSGVLRFETNIQKVLDTIMLEGLEHHITITYGDFISSLMTLAQFLKLPVLKL
jgi:L-fucose isomerase-like protein